MSANDPGVGINALQGTDLSVERGVIANFILSVRRLNGYSGPIYGKEMLITNPYFQTFGWGGVPAYPVPPPGDGQIHLQVNTSKWPPGGYHLEVMAYNGLEPVEPVEGVIIMPFQPGFIKLHLEVRPVPGTFLECLAPNLAVDFGVTAEYILTATPFGGYAGPIYLRISNLVGLHTFSVNPIPPGGGSSVLRITAPAGTYDIDVEANDQ